MARLVAAFEFKTYSFVQEAFFLCIPLGAISLHARILMFFCDRGKVNGVTDKKSCVGGCPK